MHEWIFRAAAVAIAILAYAVSIWLFVVVCIALTGWYGWHRYTHGYVPGADPDHLQQSARGDLNGSLIAALIVGVPCVIIPVGLFAAGLGYPVVFVALGVAALAAGVFFLRRR